MRKILRNGIKVKENDCTLSLLKHLHNYISEITSRGSFLAVSPTFLLVELNQLLRTVMSQILCFKHGLNRLISIFSGKPSNVHKNNLVQAKTTDNFVNFVSIQQVTVFLCVLELIVAQWKVVILWSETGD